MVDSYTWKIQEKQYLKKKTYVPLWMRSLCDHVCECVLFSVQRSRQRRASEPHTYSPRVVCENFVFFLHDAGVCALVDGVGHYGYVVVLQGDVVGVRILQQLPVLVPAETEVGRWDGAIVLWLHCAREGGYSLYFAFLRRYLLPAAKSELLALDDQLVFGPQGGRGGSHSGERELWWGVSRNTAELDTQISVG